MPQMTFAPKPHPLTEHENSSTFETWKENLLFHLTMDGSFEAFLEDEFTWGAATTAYRGLTDDSTGENKKTAKQKEALLQLMLGSIASYAPIIPRRFVTREATSLNEIWNRLRTHYGFRKSGALILDLALFTQGLKPEETYEMLWERLYSFLDDNLMDPNDAIKHLGIDPVGETMSPTLLNVGVVLWLHCIHSGLPALVKQRYASELRNKSLASLREEISESLDALLSELTGENSAVSRLSSYRSQSNQRGNYSNSARPQKFCIICSSNNRSANHYLSQCKYLPDADRKFMKMARTRAIEVEECEDQCQANNSNTERISVSEESQVRRVDVKESPVLFAEHEGHPVPITIDSGAQSDVMSEACANRLHIRIVRNMAYTASQADGQSKLKIIGEVHCTFKFRNIDLIFNGLVAETLQDDVIAGMPFLALNDVYPRPARKEIYIGDKEVVKYSNVSKRHPSKNNRVFASILRVPSRTILYPGDSIPLAVPENLKDAEFVALEPRIASPSMINQKLSQMWLQPGVIKPDEEGKVNLTNTSVSPVLLSKHEQVCNVRPVTAVEDVEVPALDPASPKSVETSKLPSDTVDYKNIEVNSSKLSESVTKAFHDLHYKYRSVFDTRTIGLYNGASGPFEVVINMGPSLPPQRKGRLPLYNRSGFEELQSVIDELDGTVFMKPEEAGVSVEYLNPSFLVKKPSGKKRLVTAFSEVGQYAKPQPAQMSNVNDVIRTIGNWKYIIKSDLTHAYWQMKLSKASMKFCGIVTPFKGVRVYTRGAMGMPGTETALEELLCRVLGNLITEGGVTKIADDLYAGADTPEELVKIWEKVLTAMEQNGLRLSPTKTVCCPSSVTILGWIWSNGTLQASPHRISALAATDPPSTVRGLRSFIGSYKSISKVVKLYSDILSPLEEVVGGKNSSDKINWTDSLVNAYKYSQEQLSNLKTLTLPRRSDQLQLVTDAASSKSGIAATLYVIRNGRPLVAGFFNSKLRPHQVNWLPCEDEALCIGAAVKFFAQDIINSNHQTVVLTDSMPCVQAYNKLCKGQFSASSRVATFLSIVSRFHVKVSHIKGSDNIISDFASRNPLDCLDSSCQVCKFIREMEDSVVREVTVKDLLNTNMAVPFSSRTSWHEMQHSCKHLSRACAHLKQGTIPSRKATDIRDVRRYLNLASIAKDGLMVVNQHGAFKPKSEKIIVPRMFLPGLLTSLHLKLQHPSRSQLKQIFKRAYYALDLDDAVTVCTSSCHVCKSLSDMPNNFTEQTTHSKPDTVGAYFAADVCQRSTQHIFLLRENVSAYTYGRIISDETQKSLRNALVMSISEFRPRFGPPATVRVDPASGFRALVGDATLKENSITVELGREKNVNKNPIAERCIRDLHAELNRIQPASGVISDTVLAVAISNINGRIRSGGLSAREIWTQRDQYTGEPIPVNDKLIIESRLQQRSKSHASSEKYRARGKTRSVYPNIKEGDLVYVNSDRLKTKPRDRYIVLSINGSDVKVQKFAGNQLRARIYTVNIANILEVPVYYCPPLENAVVSNSDSEDESHGSVHHRNSHPEDGTVVDPPSPVAEEQVRMPENEPVRRRSTRNRRPPSYLEDYDYQVYDEED